MQVRLTIQRLFNSYAPKMAYQSRQHEGTRALLTQTLITTISRQRHHAVNVLSCGKLLQGYRLWQSQPKISAYIGQYVANQSSDSVSRDGQIHLIGENGKSLGLVSFNEAKSLAETRVLELYLIKPVSHQNPHAIYQLLSKKDLYEMRKKKRAKEQSILKNRQKIKELSLSTDIGDQDITWKLNRVKEFLIENDKVKLIINKKRGSRNSHTDFLDKILEKLKDFGEMEGNLVIMENRLKCVLKPIQGIKK